MTEFAFKDYSASAAVTIVLNNLASGGMIQSTTPINNTITKYEEIEVQLSITSAAFTGSSFPGALIMSRDGSTWPSITTAAFPIPGNSVLVDYGWCDSGTSAKIINLYFRGVRPYHYRLLVQNQLGLALTAASNAATWRGTLRETR